MNLWSMLISFFNWLFCVFCNWLRFWRYLIFQRRLLTVTRSFRNFGSLRRLVLQLTIKIKTLILIRRLFKKSSSRRLFKKSYGIRLLKKYSAERLFKKSSDGRFFKKSSLVLFLFGQHVVLKEDFYRSLSILLSILLKNQTW